MGFELGPRRGRAIDVVEAMREAETRLAPEALAHFAALDLVYRSLCAILYNYVPTSGHPGGSISSGRIVAALLFDAMDYDVSLPTARTRTSSRTRPVTRPSGSTPCGRCATRC